MWFRQAIPPGPALLAEDAYTGLGLSERATEERPYVVCNFVSSADGKATASGRTAPLAGAGDKAAFHLLRTQVDAVLAGVGTLEIERYGAPIRDARLERVRVDEGRSPQPFAVLVSRSGRIPAGLPMFADSRSRIIVYAPPGAVVPDGPAQITLHEDDPSPDNLPNVLLSLRRDHAVKSLLCEGGPTLFSALLADDLVDELFLTISPVLIGGNELGVTAGGFLPSPLSLTLIWAMEHEGNLLLRYARG